ncbi:unnamed protein product [Symbiodinium pilosum]|uniref:Uncharacterized protein n=1 Tax=Symbiodinium pilosum TaxID=2952 RepID=A0A812IXP7_SYMPI|nr:unnamed protein product [Symbiodinium pilosum]
MPEQSNPERTCPSLSVHEQSPTTSSWDPPSDAAQTPELSQPQLATNPIPAGARPSSLRMKSEPLRPLLEDRLEEQGSSALVTQPVALSTLHSMPKSPTAKQKHLVFMVDGEELQILGVDAPDSSVPPEESPSRNRPAAGAGPLPPPEANLAPQRLQRLHVLAGQSQRKWQRPCSDQTLGETAGAQLRFRCAAPKQHGILRAGLSDLTWVVKL